MQAWKQADVYVQGQSHKEDNIICQDRTAYLVKNGVRVMALSDGAGSKKHSHIGAEIATKKICQIVANKFDLIYEMLEKNSLTESEFQKSYLMVKRDIMKDIIQELNNYVITNRDVNFEDLSSTLLFFAIKHDKYICGHLGDGVINVVYKGNSYYRIDTISSPENGDSPNITFFTTDSNAIDHFRLSSGDISSMVGVILMSDGPQEAFYDSNTGQSDKAINLFKAFMNKTKTEYEKGLRDLLENSVSKVSDDDLSLNILYLESMEIANINLTPYQSDILENLKSSRQLVQKSSYTYYFDDAIESIQSQSITEILKGVME